MLINDLKSDVVANGVYMLQAFLEISIKASSDFKYTFTVPASTTMRGNRMSAATIDWSDGETVALDEKDLTASHTS